MSVKKHDYKCFHNRIYWCRRCKRTPFIELSWRKVLKRKKKYYVPYKKKTQWALEQSRMRMIRSKLGKKLSDECIKKIGEAVKKRWQDPEYREKMRIRSIKQKERNAQRRQQKEGVL